MTVKASKDKSDWVYSGLKQTNISMNFLKALVKSNHLLGLFKGICSPVIVLQLLNFSSVSGNNTVLNTHCQSLDKLNLQGHFANIPLIAVVIQCAYASSKS